jgi:alpha-L-arabinofuranosidase
MVSTDLASNKTVTLGTSNAPDLVSGHAYTLVSATIDSNGVTHYVVRNPWGIAGDSLENSQGYVTLTFAQMKANFIDGCQAA